jgi:serine/threonine protein kinase
MAISWSTFAAMLEITLSSWVTIAFIFLCRILNTFQLVGAIEGLKYLHNTDIVHGDLKGVSLSVRIARTRLM